MSPLVGQESIVAMLVCKRHNDSGAGFPRSDGRLPSLLEPTLRDANRDFQGQPIRGCASIRRAAKMASRWFRRLLSESLRDWARRLGSTPSSGLLLWRFNAARSRRALNRSSFSWLVSWARLAAARSRSALKRSSLPLELSVHRLTAARLRWAARRSSLCSLVSLDRLTVAHLRWAARRSSLCSLVSLDSGLVWPFFLLLERSACTPFPDIFSSKTFSSLSFVILSKLYKSDEVSRHFRATFTQKSRENCHRQTNLYLERSALRATLLFTSPSRHRHRQTNLYLERSALRATLLFTSPSRHRHRQTNLYLESSALRAQLLFTSPSRHRHRQTNFYLESSALRATLIFTSPSRVSPPTNKLVPRKLGAPRLAGDPCSEYFPSNEGESMKGQKISTHQLVIDYRYQWIAWHWSLSIFLNYRFHQYCTRLAPNHINFVRIFLIPKIATQLHRRALLARMSSLCSLDVHEKVTDKHASVGTHASLEMTIDIASVVWYIYSFRPRSRSRK